MEEYNNFKKCSKCNHTWLNRELFLADNEIEIIGYQVDFKDLTEGLFLFNHVCGTTISIKARVFTDLYDGPVFKRRMTDSDECAGYCRIRNNVFSCNAKCECSYVRNVIQIVKDWPKTIISS
jgi:hypothetical protein